jgi:hypothetical protein
MMLADDILALNDAKVERVPVPEWGALGEKIYVRVMTGSERDRWELNVVQIDGSREKFFENMRARLVQQVVCDQDGVLIFKPEHITGLSLKSSTALDRIYGVAVRMNKLSKGDVDELEKNSGSATSGDSGSGSQRTSGNQSESVSEK